MANKLFNFFFIKGKKDTPVYFRRERDGENFDKQYKTIEKVRYSSLNDFENHEERIRKMFNIA